MDLTAVNLNITADDFDTVLVYDDQGQWTTPDPSARGFDGNDPAYLRGTYHLTEVVGAAVRLNFTGTLNTALRSSPLYDVLACLRMWLRQRVYHAAAIYRRFTCVRSGF